jgi:hypothetical protein
VYGYSKRIQWFRPAINAIHRIAKKPLLPKPGQKIEGAFISFFCVAPEEMNWAGDLVCECLLLLKNIGCEVGYLGLSPQNQMRQFLDRLAHINYLTRIDSVSWPDSVTPLLDGRPVQPEIAIL